MNKTKSAYLTSRYARALKLNLILPLVLLRVASSLSSQMEICGVGLMSYSQGSSALSQWAGQKRRTQAWAHDRCGTSSSYNSLHRQDLEPGKIHEVTLVLS